MITPLQLNFKVISMFLILIFQQFERQSSYAYQPEISNVMASITIG